MRFLLTLTACVCLIAATETRADSRIFIVANQSDGYGVDECLANSTAKPQVKAAALAIRVLAEHRLGRQDAARRTLDEATKMMPTALLNVATGAPRPEDLPLDARVADHDWQIAEILRREAEAKLRTAVP